MNILKKFGIISSDEEDKPKIKKKPEVQSIIQTSVTPIIPMESNSTYAKIIDEAFDKVDLPGPDFLEFYKTLKSIENQPLPIQQKYILAFSGFSVMGLTKDKIIQTSDIYLNAIEKERAEFKKGLDHYQMIEIQAKSDQSAKLAEENNKLQKRIQDNMSNISKLNIEVAQNTQNLATKQQSFNNTIETEKASILTIINNIKTYL